MTGIASQAQAAREDLALAAVVLERDRQATADVKARLSSRRERVDASHQPVKVAGDCVHRSLRNVERGSLIAKPRLELEPLWG